MENNVKHEGIVQSIEGLNVTVKMTVNSACSGCHAKSICGAADSRDKVVVAQNGRALYFSRSPIPYFRNEQLPPIHYKHVGIYAYRLSVLNELVQLPASPLEEAEKLEQLRWLDNGYDIFVRICDYESIGIDTPEDLERAEKMTQF